MINSPSKQALKKYDSLIQKFEFSSLKKDFNFNFSSPQSIQLMQSSSKKYFFNPENFNTDSINKEKNIKQKLENEFDNIKPKKDHYPIVFTVNDKFLDLLINIYLPNNTSENNEINEKINEINLNKNKILNESENKNEQITCICLKSNCNNNYCSCHKNKNFCNENCRCLNCKNKFDKNSNNFQNKKTESISAKNICRCKSTKCSSFYCDCKKNSLSCSEKCLCVNCENI